VAQGLLEQARGGGAEGEDCDQGLLRKEEEKIRRRMVGKKYYTRKVHGKKVRCKMPKKHRR